MGLTQPKVSAPLHGDFSYFSERKLMDCLHHLDYDIEIRIQLTQAPARHLTFIHA